jgi:hypothetical protein
VDAVGVADSEGVPVSPRLDLVTQIDSVVGDLGDTGAAGQGEPVTDELQLVVLADRQAEGGCESSGDEHATASSGQSAARSRAAAVSERGVHRNRPYGRVGVERLSEVILNAGHGPAPSAR